MTKLALRLRNWIFRRRWQTIAGYAVLLAYRHGIRLQPCIYEDEIIRITYDSSGWLVGGLERISIELLGEAGWIPVFDCTQTNLGSMGPDRFNPGDWCIHLLRLGREEALQVSSEQQERFKGL